MRRLVGVALALAALTPGCFGSRVLEANVSALLHGPRPVVPQRHPVRSDARLAVTWVGHATVLVQLDDKLVLTDPVFTPSVGQLSGRLVAPGIRVEDLPPVDAVVVSHMHFDHFSLGTLERIAPKVGTLLLPRGGKNYLTDFGFPAVELGRWKSWEKDGLRITAVPVDHVGFRYGIDGGWMRESFTGYVVEYHGLTVYFPGDTAYDPRAFGETAARFPSIDVALLPIAPIEPRSFMRHTHMDPPEALRAFKDLHARRMVPIHYDTFVNSLDEPGDALRALARAERGTDLGDGTVVVVGVGESHVFVPR